MKTFIAVWSGHVLSLVGMQVAGFFLGLEAYRASGSVMLYGLVLFATTAPLVLVAPLVGVLADRWHRGRLLAAGRVGAAACILFLALMMSGQPAPTWTVIACLALASVFQSGEFPVLSAVAAQLLTPRQLGRANGLLPLGLAISQIVAPPAACFLFGEISGSSILLGTAAALLSGAAVMIIVRIPRDDRRCEPLTSQASILSEVSAGWSFVRARRDLMWLLGLAAAVHFTLGMLEILVTPLTLVIGDTKVLGVVLAAAGGGMLLGSGLVVAWGGPRSKARTVVLVVLAQGALMLLGAARPSALLIGAVAFGLLLPFPLLASCFETVWQLQVPRRLHGRVFALRNAVTSGALPLAHLAGGPWADWSEKLMSPAGSLAPSAGLLLGTGPGRGIALIFILLSLGLLAGGAGAWLAPEVRRLDYLTAKKEGIPT